MKVLIDSGPLNSPHAVRGVGTYTRELINALKIEGKDIKKEDLGKYDVVHFTSFKPFEISLPLSKPAKTKFILTIYDLIPLIYPKHYPSGIKGKINWEINKLLIKKYIDAVITISETSKKDIARFIGVNPKKIFVTYLAPQTISQKRDEKEVAKEYNLPAKYALYVGDINYNKNIPVLVDACRLANIPLVLAGRQAREVETMNLDHPELRHLKNIDWSGTIRTGFVPEEDLGAIYSLAAVYVQPSFYEGFGLPVLEAFSAGVPVVAAKTQALVEIGETSALFADPENPGDFAEKIKKVVSDERVRNDLISSGKKTAEKFSWAKTAKETYKIYEQ
ncbi:MAG TPA: glycosyltransferase family 1 protein [Patescibacteria group bacterium]|nr:glycosyltransferase family 1 protein [Patescibacteria group bacterium]